MAKKEMTPEERKAWGEKMKAARAAKKVEENIIENSPGQHPEVQEEPTVTISQSEFNDIKKQIDELKSNNFIGQLAELLKANQGGPQITQTGVTGTLTKYSLDPAAYPDPRERLSSEQRLERFAFKINYELDWKIERTYYETKDGLNVEEPKFTLDLIRVLFDEETGEPTNKRFVVCRMVFHEDPAAAIAIAHEQNLPIDSENEKAFLDEMRYIRMRDWLFESFYAPLPQAKRNKREVVIGNKLVEVYEINSEDHERIPWENLKKAKL